jgi:hypothetical protein
MPKSYVLHLFAPRFLQSFRHFFLGGGGGFLALSFFQNEVSFLPFLQPGRPGFYCGVCFPRDVGKTCGVPPTPSLWNSVSFAKTVLDDPTSSYATVTITSVFNGARSPPSRFNLNLCIAEIKSKKILYIYWRHRHETTRSPIYYSY